MENQHQLIKGYRDLTPAELAVMNEIKGLAERVGELVNDLASERHDTDKRWVAIARTDLQTGFMALVRAVAKPTTF